ncbi:MAG: PIN domain-containing protein [Deltaproteobacteria bacterium]|nr:PIN domain-containing protein [Deltaproteobacteria bacterium]
MFLIDTSVWIDFLRGTSNHRVELLEKLLEEGEACICEIVYAEICFGASHDLQLQKYADYFSTIPFLKLPLDWHLKIGRMGYKLRKKGFKPFIADLMIAQCALTHSATLITSDKDFIPYQDLFGLVIV